MKQIKISPVIILPFLAIGPIVSVLLIWQGKNYRSDSLLPAIAVAVSLIVITAIAALIVRKKYPEDMTAMSIGLSYALTMLTVTIFSLRDAFFPIALIFAALIASPIILPFSFFWSEILRPAKDGTTKDINAKKSISKSKI
ncbi:MAG: hypothetical protein HZB33_10055 [Nitrospirae bacterium]|nr:hypothetical protein [Nitrospirota bacterium]